MNSTHTKKREGPEGESEQSKLLFKKQTKNKQEEAEEQQGSKKNE